VPPKARHVRFKPTPAMSASSAEPAIPSTSPKDAANGAELLVEAVRSGERLSDRPELQDRE
jgi:hypothetical protein